ncbi:adenosine receptor A3-like [Oculina patagonica]
MSNTSAANTSLENATDSSMTVPSKAEGIAWCSAFILTSLFIVVGNLLAIILFAYNKTLRKKSFFLVINMAFADLMLGALSIPFYVWYHLGWDFQLWTVSMSMPLAYFFAIVDNVSMVATLISAAFISGERFYAIYWPFRHRTLSSVRAYRIVIFTTWILAIIETSLSQFLLSSKHYYPVWISFGLTLTFMICGCNIGIWRKFQHGGVVSQHQNRALQNKRLTKTLMFVSCFALLSWLPIIIVNALVDFLSDVSVPWKYVYIASILNYSNCFVNPILYALRISEFKQALALCCLGREAAMNDEGGEKRKNAANAVTPATQLRTLRTDPSHINQLFEQEVMDTKL